MTRVLWLLGYLALLIAIPLQLRTTARYIEHEKPRILTTPHELALIPLTFNIPEKAIYLQPYHGMPAQPSELKYVQALLPRYARAVAARVR